MPVRSWRAAWALPLLFLSAVAGAQVGHAPTSSPYLDLDYSEEFSLLAGYARTRHDPAGVAPKSFPVLGVRYEATIIGPFALSSDLFGGTDSRDVVDPLRSAATRHVGTQSGSELGIDFAAVMNLPGTRSWHDLVPQVRAGIGLVHNTAADDSSGFAMGTAFAFVWGGGVKYVKPGSRLQLRADLTDRIFKIEYPDSYYRLAPDNTTVLTSTTAKSFYTHHTMLTLGVSYLFMH